MNGQEMSRVQSGRKGGAPRDIKGYRYGIANEYSKRGVCCACRRD